MLVSYIIWTACSAVNSMTGSTAAGIVVIVCLFAFYFHYDICFTPLLMSYSTEILPFSIRLVIFLSQMKPASLTPSRSKGLSCELLSIYCSLVIAAFVNPIGLENIGWRYYIVFCCFLVVFLATTYFFFPETRGHSLEEIAEVFDGPNAVPDTGETERKLSKVEFHEHVEKSSNIA